MFRYRQTQQLQRDLERRFSRLLKPFGLAPTHDSHPELRRKSHTAKTRRPVDEAATSTKRAAKRANKAS